MSTHVISAIRRPWLYTGTYDNPPAKAGRLVSRTGGQTMVSIT